MELTLEGTTLINGLKEVVDIEDQYLYPLIKSSRFKAPVTDTYSKYVIVTQKSIREDTSHIEADAPKTWNYLMTYKEFFSKRKSSIYKDAPPFSMFGIGGYSYACYKKYKNIRRLLYGEPNKKNKRKNIYRRRKVN